MSWPPILYYIPWLSECSKTSGLDEVEKSWRVCSTGYKRKFKLVIEILGFVADNPHLHLRGTQSSLYIIPATKIFWDKKWFTDNFSNIVIITRSFSGYLALVLNQTTSCTSPADVTDFL